MGPTRGSSSSSPWALVRGSIGLALVLLCLDQSPFNQWTLSVLPSAVHGVECSQQQQDLQQLGYVYWRNATKRTRGSVVPLPRYIKFAHEDQHLRIDPRVFEITLGQEVGACVIVNLARERYLKNYLFDDRAPEQKDVDSGAPASLAVGSLRSLTLLASGPKVFDCQPIPQAPMDESYELLVRPGEATLSAPSCWGILRGLETFSQLVFNLQPSEQRPKPAPGDAEQRLAFAIKPVEVQDEPRFPHRGLMLDTARHYISVDTILDLLDAMAFNKLNVFHWHLVDDQSFPFESTTYPELSRQGAYRPELIYSHEDVQLVILFAAMRGIRVLPELDTPGHTYALRHIPNLLSECYDPHTRQPNGDFGPIDPTKLAAYKAVNRLLDEFKSVFPEKLFHAGGDEVDFDCWKSNPNINRWMTSRNMSGDYEELSNYYLRRLYNLVRDHERTMLVWQEVFDMGADLPNDTIVHVWKNINDPPSFMRELERVVGSGYQALLSSCWYLNYIDYGQDWVKFYQCDPTGAPIRPEQKHLVLGGEICMWTEFVDDTNVISRTWPRASAAAERLWSPADSSQSVEKFLHRLEQHRCRLVYRGIQAEPVNGPGYC